MVNKIEILLKESLSLAEVKFVEDVKVQEFEKFNKEFELLVHHGFAKKRGNHLLSISDEKSVSSTIFNK